MTANPRTQARTAALPAPVAVLAARGLCPNPAPIGGNEWSIGDSLVPSSAAGDTSGVANVTVEERRATCGNPGMGDRDRFGLGGWTRSSLRWPTPSLDDQVAALRRDAGVEPVTPDDASTAAIGVDPLGPATRTPAAPAGRFRGRSLAATVAALGKDA